MSIVLILIIVFSVVVLGILVFVIKSIAAPQKVATVANLVRQKKNAAAIRIAKKILAKDSKNMETHYLLGFAYLGDNKPELAIIELRMVNQSGIFTQLCPEIPFRKRIAELYARFNQPQEALKEYLLLIKHEPAVADHYLNAGRLLEECTSSPKTASFYQKAIELDGRNWKPYFHLGTLMVREKKKGEAIAALEKSIKLNSENYAAHFYLGKLYKDEHDYPSALAAFEKAQKDSTYKIKALIERGGSFMSMKDTGRAIPELERAIKLAEGREDGDILYARYFLSLCYEQARNIDGAIQQWQKIHAKKPGFRDVAEKLGKYQDLQQNDALKDFMVSRSEEFTELCRKLATAMGLSVQSIKNIDDGCQVLCVEGGEGKWRNARKTTVLLRILRSTEAVDEPEVRSFYEEMKAANVARAVFLTSSTFSRAAAAFVENRPLELWNKEKLQASLQKLQ
ncbi:MAG: tetratricopeptide repeat protein [Spirochaetales bacterium]|jgi:tetratricopeptide (TPR) repeat protein|nr:tetratricopeptide repeat protein [Spirochaetales bacterium]